MKKITIENMDGTMEEVTQINAFGISELNKDFIILTKNESIGDGLTKIYVSEVIEETPGVFKLLGIADEEVWSQVKKAMKEVAGGEE